jgi:DNA-binding CsgD family transcriptional regulator
MTWLKNPEAIAADIGVAASSAITYHKRAYEKLGITSRGALFALCRE